MIGCIVHGVMYFGCSDCDAVARGRPRDAHRNAVAVQSMPTEVRMIVDWLRSPRFASAGFGQSALEIADMIEKGDPMLDDLRPWDARLIALRRVMAKAKKESNT